LPAFLRPRNPICTRFAEGVSFIPIIASFFLLFVFHKQNGRIPADTAIPMYQI
jgi:hypothetical protein